MAVKIKLKRMGKIRAPQYRIVVADARAKRDGRAIEEIGRYHPRQEPSLIEVDSARVVHWLSVGAQPTEPVRALLRRTGDWQRFRGEPAPEPLRTPAPRPDRRAVFDAAAREAAGEPGGAATTARGRRTAKGTQSAASEPATKPSAAEASGAEPDQAAGDPPSAGA